MTTTLQSADCPPSASPHPPSVRTARLILLVRIALLLCAAVFAAAVFLPFTPRMPATGLDPSWEFGMNRAIAAGMAIGRDVVFTFGPYAFVYVNYYEPALVSLHFASSAIIWLAFIAALMVLSMRSARPTLSSALAAAFAAFLTQVLSKDVVYLSIPLLFFLLILSHQEQKIKERAALLLLAIAMAILTLTKGSFAISSGLVLGVSAVCAALRRRALDGLFPCAVFAAAVPSLWMLAGQNIVVLPDFARNAIEIIRGYSNAMSLQAPIWQPALYCLIAAAMLGLHRRQFQGGLTGIALFLGAGAMLFLAFKAGFVRHDGHAVIAAGVLATTSIGLLMTAPVRKSHWLAAALALSGWSAITSQWAPLTSRVVLERTHGVLQRGVAGAIERIRQPEALAARYAAALAAIRAQQPVPPVQGSADIYSYDQARLLAHDIAWSPRPVFQSYSAYTQRLVEMNANHLRGNRAPGTVFFAVQPIDGRLAALEDGPSWLPLLSLYRFVRQTEGVAVLERRLVGEERAITMSPLVTGRHDIGARVSLPDGVVWASVEIRPTLLGQLVSILFRAPVLQISLHMLDGSVDQRRFIPGPASAGFLISPAIRSTSDFVRLSFGPEHLAPHQKPVAFSIEGRALARFTPLFWSSRFQVGLQTIQFAAEGEAPGQFGVRPERIEISAADQMRRQSCHLDTVDGRSLQGQSVLPAGRFIEVAGWAFLQGPPRRAADDMALLLVNSSGSALRFPIEPIVRPDVARHFGQADLTHVGFHTHLDLLGHSGEYLPHIEVSGPQGREICVLGGSPIKVVTQ